MAIPVLLSRNGMTVYPATIADAIIDPETGLPIDLQANELTEEVKSDIIDSAVSAVPGVTSVLSATSASVAYGLDDTIKADIIASATSTPVTSVASAGVAESITDELKGLLITSAVAEVPPVTSVASAGIASGLTAEVKNDIIASANTGGVPVAAAYMGPFAVSVSEGFVCVNSGILCLGGTESTIASTSVTSADGNVYFYMYYDGNYNVGIEIASSASALTSAAAITGSAGYYTAIASVNNNIVTQYQYGNISINGRIQ